MVASRNWVWWFTRGGNEFSHVFSQNVSKGKGKVPSIYGTWRNTMNQRINRVSGKHFPCQTTIKMPKPRRNDSEKNTSGFMAKPSRWWIFQVESIIPFWPASLYSGDGDTGVNSGGGWLTVRGLTPRSEPSHPKNELNWTKNDGRILPTKKKVS